MKYSEYPDKRSNYKRNFNEIASRIKDTNSSSFGSNPLQKGIIWILVCLYSLSLVQSEGEAFEGTKICASGSVHDDVNGAFEYEYWDSAKNAPVYKRELDGMYVYPFFGDNTRSWHIDLNPDDSFAASICSVTGTTEFKLEDCVIGWKSVVNGIWVNDTNMRLVNCTDVCVKGNERTWLNGVYIWQYFNRTINGSVYYCKDCDSGSTSYDGAYLFPRILSQNDTVYRFWGIHGDIGSNAWSACFVLFGEELGSDYVFNLNDCTRGWSSHNVATGEITPDGNLTVEVCVESVATTTTTQAPVRSEITIPTILWFIIALLVIMDIIIVSLCIYYMQKKLLKRVKEPYNAPWIAAIKQFGPLHFLGVAMEIYDIVTDYTFSVDLILTPDDDLTKVTLGWAALIISAIGLILFVCKFMAIRKLVGKQIARYRHQLRTTKNEKTREEIMEKIRTRIMDVDVLSLFNGCIEDVPTTIIVLIIFTNYKFNVPAILCITGNVISFGLKLTTIIMGKCGCKDVADEYDPNEKPLETTNVTEGEKQDIVIQQHVDEDNDGSFTHSTHQLLELQDSIKC